MQQILNQKLSEGFMHENLVGGKFHFNLNANEISMHKNECFAQRFSRMRITCMKLCTAECHIKCVGRKNHHMGKVFIFMHGNFIFSCIEISYFHAWKFHIFMLGNVLFLCTK